MNPAAYKTVDSRGGRTAVKRVKKTDFSGFQGEVRVPRRRESKRGGRKEVGDAAEN